MGSEWGVRTNLPHLSNVNPSSIKVPNTRDRFPQPPELLTNKTPMIKTHGKLEVHLSFILYIILNLLAPEFFF